jgi:pimeloyl-ACP methyl ester carboxylesterase
VITFDFLGWGNSDKPQNYAYTFAGQRDDLDAVIEYFNLPEVSLVAHDAAGPAAVNWALDHPDRTASLTLMNAFYGPAPTLRPPALVALFQLGHLDAPVLGADLTANLAAISEQIARDPVVFEQLFVWQEQRFFARAADADTFIPLFYEQFSGANSSRAPLLSLASDTIPAVAANLQRLPELARLPRPIRLIWGDRDPDLNSDSRGPCKKPCRPPSCSSCPRPTTTSRSTNPSGSPSSYSRHQAPSADQERSKLVRGLHMRRNQRLRWPRRRAGWRPSRIFTTIA